MPVRTGNCAPGRARISLVVKFLPSSTVLASATARHQDSYLTSAVAESSGRKAWRSVWSVKSVIQHCYLRGPLVLLVRRRRRKGRARTEPLERDAISLTSPISLTCSCLPSLKSFDYSPRPAATRRRTGPAGDWTVRCKLCP